MPKKLENKLKHEVSTNPKYKHLSQERKNAIVYSVLRKTGWKPGQGEAIDLTPEQQKLDKNETVYEAELLHNMYMEL